MIKSVRLKAYAKCDQCGVRLPPGSIVYVNDDISIFFCTKDCVKRYKAGYIMTLKYNVMNLMSHIENEIYHFEQKHPNVVPIAAAMIIILTFLFSIIVK